MATLSSFFFVLQTSFMFHKLLSWLIVCDIMVQLNGLNVLGSVFSHDIPQFLILNKVEGITVV